MKCAKSSVALLCAAALSIAACGGGESEAEPEVSRAAAADDPDGADEPSETEEAPEATTGATTAPAAGGAIETTDDTLEIWTHLCTESDEAVNAASDALFKAVYPDVEIEYNCIPFAEVTTRVVSAAATGEGPDVLFTNPQVHLTAYTSADAVADLTPYWDAYPDAAQFPDSIVWRDGEGAIATVQPYGNLLALYYNQDILTEIGVDVPTTLEELEAAMRAAVEAGHGGIAISAPPDALAAWQGYPWLTAYGSEYCAMDPAGVTQAFTMLDRWAADGLVPLEAATWDQASAFQAFMSGDYAFGLNGNWQFGIAADAEFALGTTPVPAGPAGSRVLVGGEGRSIGAFADDPNLAWEYLRLAWFSQEARSIGFETVGHLPVRADMADSAVVASQPLAEAFITAIGTAATWPQNENSPAAQAALGLVISSLVSDQVTPEEAAEQAISGVEAALADGGGC